MENRKKLGAILIGVVLALQTVGCGKTEPPVNSGSTQNDIPASEETGQSSVGAQGNTSGKISDEDLQQSETTDAENTENTGESKVLIAYFTAGENSDVDVVSSASVTTVDGEAKGRLRAVADMIQTPDGRDAFFHTDIRGLSRRRRCVNRLCCRRTGGRRAAGADEPYRKSGRL